MKCQLLVCGLFFAGLNLFGIDHDFASQSPSPPKFSSEFRALFKKHGEKAESDLLNHCSDGMGRELLCPWVRTLATARDIVVDGSVDPCVATCVYGAIVIGSAASAFTCLPGATIGGIFLSTLEIWLKYSRHKSNNRLNDAIAQHLFEWIAYLKQKNLTYVTEEHSQEMSDLNRAMLKGILKARLGDEGFLGLTQKDLDRHARMAISLCLKADPQNGETLGFLVRTETQNYEY